MNELALLGDPARMAVGAVFVVSAVAKARRPRAFANGVRQYEVLPPSLSYAIGLVLIPAEAITAFLLLTGYLSPLGLVAALCLLLCFGLAVTINLLRGRSPSCYCFGSGSSEQVSRRTVERIGLLGFAVVLAFASQVSPPPGGSILLPFATTIGLQIALAGFLLAAGSWLLVLPRPFHVWRRVVATRHRHGVAPNE